MPSALLLTRLSSLLPALSRPDACLPDAHAYTLPWQQMMESGFRPTGWLGLIVGTRVYFNFHPSAVNTDDAFMNQVDALVREVGERGRLGPKQQPAVLHRIEPAPAPAAVDTPPARAPAPAPPALSYIRAGDIRAPAPSAPAPAPALAQIRTPPIKHDTPMLPTTPPQGQQTMPSMAMSPIQRSTVDSSAVLELSRTALEGAKDARSEMKEMTQTMLERDDRLRREVTERDERVRREAREDAKDRERQMALQIQQLRQELGRNSAGFVPRWSLGGWLVRLAALVLVLRWRPLFKLIGRLGDI